MIIRTGKATRFFGFDRGLQPPIFLELQINPLFTRFIALLKLTGSAISSILLLGMLKIEKKIPKNLRANNSARSQVEVLGTPKGTVKGVLLKELFNLLTTDFQKVGILARNWRGEINEIQGILKSSELDKQGFEIDWEKLDDPWKQSDEPDKKNKRKMFLRRDKMEIEIINIHTAKGREWDKVILLVNTMYDCLPDRRNDPADERRLFYVAITRAQQELVVLDGGNCQFIPEFQNAPPTKEELEEAFRVELAAREPKLKIELEEASKAALVALESRLKEELEEASKVALKQHEPELNHLRRAANEHKNETEKMELALPQQIKSTNDAFLEGLIPVLDKFESQINSLPATVESNKVSDDFEVFTERVRLTHKQMLDSLKNYGIRSIETVGKFFNPTHHEKVSSDIYSDEVQTGRIAKEEQRGYLLHDQVVRKAQVVISKRKQQADVFLSQDFAQPVRFVTYTGLRDLRNIETFKDGVKGLDSQDKEVQLQSLNLLFAFPKEDMKALKPCIKRWLVIARRNLQPIALTSERFHVADDILKQLLIEKNTTELDIQNPTVRLTTRSGHVLNGHLWDFDEDFLYMNINEKNVIVYRSGILKFVNLIWNHITKAYKNNASINGHIIEQSKSGLRVKFKSLTGFLPASQVEIKTVRNLDLYVGKTLKMKVTKLSKSNNNIVFSRRALLEEERTKLFNTFREIPEEPTALRNIEKMFKTVEPISGTNGSPLFSRTKRIPLDKSISVIVAQPVEKVIDTPPPISTDFTETLNTYVKDFKPETHQTVEVQRDPLYEPIDLIVRKPVKKVVDIRPSTPAHSSETSNSQIQNLTPETLEIEIVSKPREEVNNNSQLTVQEREDILKTHIQNLTSETLETKDMDNTMRETILETDIDNDTSVDSTIPTSHDSPIAIGSEARQIEGQDSLEDDVEHVKKGLGYYLRQGRRFVIGKLKAAIFRKPRP